VTVTPKLFGDFIGTKADGHYTWSTELTQDASVSDLVVYLKNGVHQISDALSLGEIKIDTSAPTGTIEIDNRSWAEFLNNITFGIVGYRISRFDILRIGSNIHIVRNKD
jgi:hypothetical protein